MNKGFPQTYTVNFKFEVVALSENAARDLVQSQLKVGARNLVVDSSAMPHGDAQEFRLCSYRLVAAGLKVLQKQRSGDSPQVRAYRAWLEDFTSEFTQEIVNPDSVLYAIDDQPVSEKILWETVDGLFEFAPSRAIAELLSDSRKHGVLDHHGIAQWLKTNAKVIDRSLMLIYDFA